MWGILRNRRRFSVAALSSLVLLVASIAPCTCMALSSADGGRTGTQKQHSEDSHPCGSHSKSDSNGSDKGANDSHNESHSNGCGSDCCCSSQSLTALVDVQTLVKAQSTVVDEPMYLSLQDLFLRSNSIFVNIVKIFPRGSPGGGLFPFVIRSSSTLSVRLQRWLI